MPDKLKRYRVTQTTVRHIDVDAWYEDLAVIVALITDDNEWSTERDDVEVREIEGEG